MPLGENLYGAGEAGAERLLQRHVELAEGFELASARERTGVDGAQAPPLTSWLTVRLASSSFGGNENVQRLTRIGMLACRRK